MRPFRSVAAVLVPGVMSLACQIGPGSGDASVERRLAAMGTWLELTVRAADRAQALAASEAAVRAIEAAEARLSTWRSDSELARLNRAPVGTEVVLSAELAADLERAGRCWRATDGAFDPGLGALVAAWGLRTGGRRPTPDELAAAREAGGFAGFSLDGRRAVRRHALAAIEEGGFGKGIGLDAALLALQSSGAREAVVDLGGQVALLGPHPFRAALADPADRARPVLELSIDAGSLSTTGNSERGIVVDGVARAHVLDPRSGQPADDFGSLTVWATDATAADCLSTGLFVLGPEGAFRWLEGHAEIELVVLRRVDGRLIAEASDGWRGRTRALVPEIELRLVPSDGELTSATAIPPHTSR